MCWLCVVGSFVLSWSARQHRCGRVQVVPCAIASSFGEAWVLSKIDRRRVVIGCCSRSRRSVSVLSAHGAITTMIAFAMTLFGLQVSTIKQQWRLQVLLPDRSTHASACCLRLGWLWNSVLRVSRWSYTYVFHALCLIASASNKPMHNPRITHFRFALLGDGSGDCKDRCTRRSTCSSYVRS